MNAALKSHIYLVSVLIVFFMSSTVLHAQNQQDMKPEDTEFYEPTPPVVDPGEDIFLDPPSDAIILFDGTDMSKWETTSGKEVSWIIEDGVLTVDTGDESIERIQTKESFGDVQLYLEWRSPMNMEHKGQDRGNSGVFFQSRYEVQVLDAYNNPTYINGMAGSIYKQRAPLVNPSKKPGEWESYNISFTAPRFNEDGSLKSPGRVTVIWNGVVVQNNTEILGTTPYIGYPEYNAHGEAPLQLQDHNSKVSFRNIWIRRLDSDNQFSIEKYMD